MWLSIRDRCNNPNNERFSRYGARGISLSAELNTFDAFLSYVSSLPNYPYTSNLKVCKDISIDRIDSDKDYTVGNLRWADVYTQAANKTWKKPNSTSSYKGVCYCKTYHVWVAKVQW